MDIEHRWHRKRHQKTYPKWGAVEWTLPLSKGKRIELLPFAFIGKGRFDTRLCNCLPVR